MENIGVASLSLRTEVTGVSSSFAAKPELDFQSFTLQGIKHIPPGEVWKIIFKMPFLGDMLVPWRVTN